MSLVCNERCDCEETYEGDIDGDTLAPLPAGVDGSKWYYIAYQHKGNVNRRGFLKDEWKGREMSEILAVRQKLEPHCHWWWVEKPAYKRLEPQKGEM